MVVFSCFPLLAVTVCLLSLAHSHGWVCDPLPPPENGNIRTSNDAAGHHSTYSCNKGFVLQDGDKVRTCLMHGAWSGKKPSCGQRLCPMVPSDNYQDIRYSDGLNVNSVAILSCNDGYKLVGNGGLSQRQCRQDGTWSGSSTICQLVLCMELPTSDVLSVEYPDGRGVGAVARFSCAKNYRLDGSRERRCLQTESWSHETPNCLKIQCPKSVVTPNVNVYSTDSNNVDSVLTYTCLNDGYNMTSGDRERVCQENGTWSGQIPQCTRIECDIFEKPSNSKIEFSSDHFAYSKAVFSCDAGYELMGGTSRECLPSGIWSGFLPRCLRKCYVKDLDFGNISKKSGVEGENVTYTCDDGYRITGDSMQWCMKDGSWNGTRSKCERK